MHIPADAHQSGLILQLYFSFLILIWVTVTKVWLARIMECCGCDLLKDCVF